MWGGDQWDEVPSSLWGSDQWDGGAMCPHHFGAVLRARLDSAPTQQGVTATAGALLSLVLGPASAILTAWPGFPPGSAQVLDKTRLPSGKTDSPYLP
jgi:hypothetical protein